jgi:tetratricopeptide (TPR) repeat protein
MPIRIVLAAFVCLIYATAQRGPDVPAEVASGLQFARQGRYLDAERVLKAYAEQNPDRPEPQAILAQLYYHFGYYANALPAFDKAVALAPADRQSRVFAAVCLFKTGAEQQAETATKKLLAEQPPPNDIDLTLTYAQYLFEKRDLDAALTQARAAVGFAPRHPIGYFWLARILQAKGESNAATEAAEQSVKLAPQLPYARNLLVRLYRLQGRLDEAQQQAQWLKDFEAQKASP